MAAHLSSSVAAIDIEFSYIQDMAPVFADAVARWLAEIGQGWVKDDDGKWWRLDDRNFYCWSQIIA